MKWKKIRYRKSREVNDRKTRETNREGIDEEEKRNVLFGGFCHVVSVACETW